MRIQLWGGPCDGQEHDVVLPLPPFFHAMPPTPAGAIPALKPWSVRYLMTRECVGQKRIYIFEGIRKLVEA